MNPNNAVIAVTGSTGALGGRVAQLLSAAGVAPTLLVRDPTRAPHLPDAVVHQAGYGDAAAAEAGLAGVDTLFMVSAAESADRLDQHRTFIDAAVRAGVRHIVYTSFLAAAPDAVFTLARDHAATEEHLRSSGLRWTFLRDNFYMDAMPHFVGSDGVLRGPAGDGRCSLVARSDVARVAAAVLQQPGQHLDATYDLTGPEPLTMTEIAAAIGTAQQRQVSYHAETVPEAYQSRRRWEAPDWQYDAWVSTYTAIASGALAAVSTDVETITGVAPVSFADYLSGGD